MRLLEGMARESGPSLNKPARSVQRAGAIVLVALSSYCVPIVPGSGSGLPATPSLNVCVFFDVGEGSYPNGHLHAIMLENLLGHFRQVRVRTTRVLDGSQQPLTNCDRAAYIGSYFHQELPSSFLDAVASYGKPFLWINYNIDQLQKAMGSDAFAGKTGFLFDRVVGFDKDPGSGQEPAFFRYVLYRGERFVKFAFKKSGEPTIIAAPDIAVIHPKSAQILATALHSSSGRTTPYAVRKGSFFYIADNPFLFIHEQDRYLVLADLLFDFLDLPARAGKHYALIRLEDVHPEYDIRLLDQAVDLLKKENIPFAISLIPKYVAPGMPESGGIDIEDRPGFLQALRRAQRARGELLLHGYTHAVEGLKDCAPLGTAFDYEFWDRCSQTPLPFDSDRFVVGRLSRALQILRRSRLTVAAWVTPHYAASPEDFRIFGRFFQRTVQRVTYSAEDGGKTIFVSQFFPYTIYRDHYGQFVWPENLGFVPLPGSNWGAAAPDDIAASIPLAAVVRDGWASFYWHPVLAAQPSESRRLQQLIDEIRAHGFEFVSLNELHARGE